MAAYRELEPGLYELETPGGPLSVTSSEEELRANGHFPESLSLHKTGATASNAAPAPRLGFGPIEVRQDSDRAGVGQLPGLSDALTAYRGPSASDAQPAQSVGPALDNSAGLAALRGADPARILTTAKDFREEEERQKAERGAGPDGKGGALRGGGEIREIRGGGDRGGSSSGGGGGSRMISKGGDVRVGFSVQKSGLRKEDIDDAELAEADASIDRKMGAQNIADRRGTQTEALSAEMGRQIRAEGVALRQQQERNEAQRKDYEERQAAIDAERDQVAKLAVTPADLVAEGGVTGVLAAITMLAAGYGGQAFDGRNLAKEAIQQNLDRKVEQMKAHVDGKENDLDRLTKIYGSPAEAEAEYRDRQRMMVQALGQKMAVDAGATDAADALRMQFADWDDERAQSRLARQEALAGRVTEQWALQPPRFSGPPKANEADVQKLAKAREEAGIGEQEGEAGEVKDLIGELPEGELPTPGSRNVISRGARSVVDFVGGEGSAAQAFDSDAERAGAAKFSRKMNAIKSKLLGAARSPAEIQDFNEGFANVRTKEGMQQFAADWQRKIDRREAGVKAGFRPEVVETFEERQRSRQPTRRSSTLRGE